MGPEFKNTESSNKCLCGVIEEFYNSFEGKNEILTIRGKTPWLGRSTYLWQIKDTNGRNVHVACKNSKFIGYSKLTVKTEGASWLHNEEIYFSASSKVNPKTGKVTFVDFFRQHQEINLPFPKD